MKQFETYMQNLKVEDVPWHRLLTAYGRASDFPEYLNTLSEMSHLASIKNALNEITSHIEHQSTLWHCTPFAMIFLIHTFKQALSQINQNTCADYVVESLLDFFMVIAECFHDYNEQYFDDETEPDTPLSSCSELLLEKYLPPEDYDEEDDWECLEEDDILYSFWYYSYAALLQCKPLLKELEDTPFQAAAKELEEQLYL